MTLAPDENEIRVREQLRARIDGTPPGTPPTRPRDWLDDLMEDRGTPAARPPGAPIPAAKPPAAKTERTAPGEPRFDWRRLTHWSYARLTIGASATLIPLYQGQPAAGVWAHVLRQARGQAGVLPAWIIAAAGIGAAAVLVHRRRSWWAYGLLSTAFIGTVAMASPYDLITLVTGVTR